eukprot:scaffold211263_cov62-Attheya_sp.AAC.1
MSTVDKSELEDAVLISSNNHNVVVHPAGLRGTQHNNGEPGPMFKMIRKAFSYQKCGNEWHTVSGIDPFLIDLTDRSTKGKLIFKNVIDNKYFLVIPQRHDWASLGWDDVTN